MTDGKGCTSHASISRYVNQGKQGYIYTPTPGSDFCIHPLHLNKKCDGNDPDCKERIEPEGARYK